MLADQINRDRLNGASQFTLLSLAQAKLWRC